ncbi:MAG: hypothetical protein ACT4TC_26770 [Myxococcaceae bacterium]
MAPVNRSVTGAGYTNITSAADAEAMAGLENVSPEELGELEGLEDLDPALIKAMQDPAFAESYGSDDFAAVMGGGAAQADAQGYGAEASALGYKFLQVTDEADKPVMGPDGQPAFVNADAEGNPEIGPDGGPLLRRENGEPYTAAEFGAPDDAAAAARTDSINKSALETTANYGKVAQIAAVGGFGTLHRGGAAALTAMRETLIKRNGMSVFQPKNMLAATKDVYGASKMAMTNKFVPGRALASNAARAGQYKAAQHTFSRLEAREVRAEKVRASFATKVEAAAGKVDELQKAVANGDTSTKTSKALTAAKIQLEKATAKQETYAKLAQRLKDAKSAFVKSTPGFAHRGPAAGSPTLTARAGEQIAKTGRSVQAFPSFAKQNPGGAMTAAGGAVGGAAKKATEAASSAGSAVTEAGQRAGRAVSGVAAPVGTFIQASGAQVAATAVQVGSAIGNRVKQLGETKAGQAVKGTRAYQAASGAVTRIKLPSASQALQNMKSGTAAAATRVGGVGARVAGAVGRALPGISIGIAAMDTVIAGKTLADDNASGSKKALAVGAAALSSVAAAAANSVPLIGSGIGLVAGLGAAALGYFRDKE